MPALCRFQDSFFSSYLPGVHTSTENKNGKSYDTTRWPKPERTKERRCKYKELSLFLSFLTLILPLFVSFLEVGDLCKSEVMMIKKVSLLQSVDSKVFILNAKRLINVGAIDAQQCDF